MRGRPAQVLISALIALVAALSPGAPATAAPDRGPAQAQAQATAGRIVYVCGMDLCAVDPDSGASARITSDSAGYQHPSVSLDGNRIAAARGWDVIAGPYGSNLPEQWATGVEGLNEVAISPDGSAVAATFWYTKLELRYTYVCGGMCLQVVHYRAARYWPSAGATPVNHSGTTGVGFLGSGLVSRDLGEGDFGPEEQLCVVANPTDDADTCVTRVREPSPQAPGGRDVVFSHPTGSPDGTLVAAALGLQPEAAGALADNPVGEEQVVNVYDAASGAKITQVGEGLNPSFSPDGTRIVFQGRDGWLYVVGAQGGTPRQLVQGTQPTWGGGSITAPVTAPPPVEAAPVEAGTVKVGRKPLKAKGKKLTVKVACPASAEAGCAGLAQLRTQKKDRALSKARSYRMAAGRTTKVKLTLTRKGLNALPKGKVRKARITLTTEGADKPTVRKKVKVRRR